MKIFRNIIEGFFRTEKRKVLGHTAIYGLGILAQKAVGFIMIPVYTHYLVPADYGLLEMLTTTFEIIDIFFGMGIVAAMTRYYYEFEVQEDRNLVVSTALVLLISTFSVGASGVFLLSAQISTLVFGKEGYEIYFKLMVVNFFLTSVLELPFAYIRAKQQSIKFVLLGLARLLLALSLNIYLICFLKLGVLGILYSGIITSFVFCIWLIGLTVREVGRGFSRKLAVQMVKYGTPLAVSFVGSFILTFSDRYFLRALYSLSDVGIYGIGYKFATILPVLVAGPFFQIWGVKRFEIAKRNDGPQIFAAVFKYFTFVLIVMSVGMVIYIKPAIVIITAEQYHNSYTVVPLLLLAFLFESLFRFTNAGILISKRTKYLSLTFITATVVCLAGNCLLIPHLGMQGAALARAIAGLVLLMLGYKFAQRFYYVSYDWIRVVKLMTVGVCVCILVEFVNVESFLPSLLIRTLYFFVFTSFAFCGGYFTRKEMRALFEEFGVYYRRLIEKVAVSKAS